MKHGRVVPAGGSVSSTKYSTCCALGEKVHVGVERRGQPGAQVHFGGCDCCDCLALSLLALFSSILGSITGLSLSLVSGPSLSDDCLSPFPVVHQSKSSSIFHRLEDLSNATMGQWSLKIAENPFLGLVPKCTWI